MQKYVPNKDNICPSYRGVFNTLSSIYDGNVSEPEIVLQSCFYKKVFWKYASYLQQNTTAEV